MDTQIDVFDATVGSLLLVSLDCVHLPNQTVFEIIQRHPSDNVLTLRLRVTGYSEDIRINGYDYRSCESYRRSRSITSIYIHDN